MRVISKKVNMQVTKVLAKVFIGKSREQTRLDHGIVNEKKP